MMKKNPVSIIVAFYTSGYESEVNRFRASLNRLKCAFHIEHYPCRGNWAKNTKIKVEFITKMLQKYGRILYIDVDAIVWENPLSYLEGLKCDIAIHRLGGGTVYNGTIWLNDSSRTQTFLKRWSEEMERASQDWDQTTFERAMISIENLSIADLPAAYLYIFDRSPCIAGPNSTLPIIEHFHGSAQPRLTRPLSLQVQVPKKRSRLKESEFQAQGDNGAGVVSFFTSDYEYEVHKLRSSLLRLNIPFKLQRVPELGTWARNVSAIPGYVSTALLQVPKNTGLLYLDSDAIVWEDPRSYFEAKHCDIVVFHKTNKHWNPACRASGGTLWFRNTRGVHTFLRAWQDALTGTTGNQKGLSEVLTRSWDLKISNMAPEYIRIFPPSLQTKGEIQAPVIEHFQASRFLKTKRELIRSMKIRQVPCAVRTERRQLCKQCVDNAGGICQVLQGPFEAILGWSTKRCPKNPPLWREA